jgi:type I restriction enzyme S subunit
MPTENAPVGFSWRLLADLARLETGHTPSRRVPGYWENGTIPWLGVRDATGNHGRTIVSTHEYITELGEQNSSTRLLPKDTVCLSRTASVGYVVVMGVPMCTSQDFVNWVCGPELDFRYLKYILLGEKEAFLRFASGTTHQTVYFPEVKAFHVMVPPASEQRAIAGVLGALDDKIESNRRVWALASSLVRSEYEASIRDGETKFCNLADISRFNVSTRKPGSPSEMISYIDISSVESGTVSGVQQMAWADAPSRARRGVSDGDIIFSTVRPARMAFSAMINPTPEIVVSTGFAVMSPRNVPMTLLLALVSDTDFGNFCESVSQGSAYPAVSPEAMGTFPVEIPTGDVLEQFGERTEPVLRRAYAGTLENRTLTELRDALIPELLSGRLRVRDAEKIVEEVV